MLKTIVCTTVLIKLPTISVNVKDVTFTCLVHITMTGNENELLSVTLSYLT